MNDRFQYPYKNIKMKIILITILQVAKFYPCIQFDCILFLNERDGWILSNSILGQGQHERCLF